eukprot:scaffold22604_cov130-Cylindrotheca_fusiformis.AAC.11
MSNRRLSNATTAAGGLNRKLRFNAKMKTREIIEWLREAKAERHYTILTFDEVTFNPAIVAEVLDLMRTSSSHGRIWERMNLEFCAGPLDMIVTGAIYADCIRHLFLASDKIQDDLMERFATTLRITTVLKSLWLLIPMTEATATHLADGITHNSSIDRLSLSGSNWDLDDDSDSDDDDTRGSEDTSLAAKSVKQKSAGNDKDTAFDSTAAPTALAKGLRLNDGIRILDLSCCYLQDDAITPMIQAMVDHEYLEVLDVSRNVCRTQAVEALAEILGTRECRLRTLDLREQTRKNPLDISPISYAIRHNDSLETLRLSHNKLVDSQVLELADSLRGNSILQELDLQYNQITEKGVPGLTKYIKELPALTTLLLGGNAFGEEGYNILDSLPDDDDSICTVHEEEIQKANQAKKERRRSSAYTAPVNNLGFLTGISE